MHRFSSLTVLALFALVSSCGGARLASGGTPSWAQSLPADLPIEGELRVRPEEREDPSIELRFPWGNPEASLGWGAVHLWARPAVDHVGVSAIIDAPAAHARWRECGDVVLRSGGGERRLEATHIERPLEAMDGVYEAVRIQLDILQIRKLADAPHVSGSICGDTFALTESQRASLRRFVRWFDEIATPQQLRDAPSFRDVGPRPGLPGDEDEDAEPLDA